MGKKRGKYNKKARVAEVPSARHSPAPSSSSASSLAISDQSDLAAEQSAKQSTRRNDKFKSIRRDSAHIGERGLLMRVDETQDDEQGAAEPLDEEDEQDELESAATIKIEEQRQQLTTSGTADHRRYEDGQRREADEDDKEAKFHSASEQQRARNEQLDRSRTANNNVAADKFDTLGMVVGQAGGAVSK